MAKRSAARRSLRLESLEQRQLMAGDAFASLHNASRPTDVNGDGDVTPIDALNVINYLSRLSSPAGEFGNPMAGDTTAKMVDVDNSGNVTALDALLVINDLMIEGEMVAPANVLPVPLVYSAFPKAPQVGTTYDAEFNEASMRGGDENELQASDVEALLARASAATRSNDAIIAVVDRNGTILGVRVESGVTLVASKLGYAIDGAVAKARTAAFFSSGQAPLTSRTIRSLSQSTVTQREVESSPVVMDERYQGPGFVAPIGVGGKFPPEVDFTPQVDLFAIEHQSRDSQLHTGADQKKNTADDFALRTRFNADPTFIPTDAQNFFQTWPEAYDVQTRNNLAAQSRGIATLPGGIPLFKTVVEFVRNPDGSIVRNPDGTPVTKPVTSPVSESINLVGGIGVFFPGEDGYASFEQGFVAGVNQSEKARTNAPKVLEAEFAAFIAAAGGGIVTPNTNFQRNLNEFNSRLPKATRFVLPNGRIDLVGITLEIFGPNPTREHRIPGIDRLIEVGRANFGGLDFVSGVLKPVTAGGALLLDGKPVPEGWLVAPHDSEVDKGLTAEIVDQIIRQGIAEAELTRAAIRLDVDNDFRPGARTSMVLAVTDSTGELLGLHRMPDATVFSIDVAIAKARNVSYYADARDGVLQDADRIDFDGDGVIENVSTSLSGPVGDTLPIGTAVTNRTIRFLAEPRYPTGQELPANAATGLNGTDSLCDQKPEICRLVGPQSILRLPGINPKTGENLADGPLEISVYNNLTSSSVLAFDSFNVGRNFRDQGDSSVVIHGTDPGTITKQPLANQNGIVFFPGSSPLYLNNDPKKLVGGFGVSGDGVDQDDVVTSAGQVGYAAPTSIRADQFPVGGVRLPYQKFNRDPRA